MNMTHNIRLENLTKEKLYTWQINECREAWYNLLIGEKYPSTLFRNISLEKKKLINEAVRHYHEG